MTRLIVSLGLILISASLGRTAPQDPPKEKKQEEKKADEKKKEDPMHEELRGLRADLIDAVNTNNLDKLLSLLDEDVVVTFMNAEVGRKPAGVKAYYDKMMTGDKKIVKTIKIEPEVDELTHLYGKTGIATGKSKDTYELTDGRSFTVETRWSAALVKKDGKWKIASFHASTSPFDNPILTIAVQRTAYWVGGIAGVVGIVVGLLVMWLWKKRQAPKPA